MRAALALTLGYVAAVVCSSCTLTRCPCPPERRDAFARGAVRVDPLGHLSRRPYPSQRAGRGRHRRTTALPF